MRLRLPILILPLLLLSSERVFAQRSTRTELWHEVIRLRQQFQREKVEVIRARQRLAKLKKMLQKVPKDHVEP